MPWGVGKGWMADAVMVRVGREGQLLPAGLQHRFMVVEQPRKLIVMCRQLRQDLQQCALRPASIPPRAPAGVVCLVLRMTQN